MNMQNRTKFAALAVFFLIIGSAAPASASDVPDWAREQLLKPWYAAFNAEDANALADLYTSDGRTGPASGRSEIIALFESYWVETRISCSGDYDGFHVIGGLATGWGHDHCIITPRSGGKSMTEHSLWLAVYERQANGSWLCIRETFETVR